MGEKRDKILDKLNFLYDDDTASRTRKRIEELVDRYGPDIPKGDAAFTEKDVVLITYGDSFRKEGIKPLAALFAFLDGYLRDVVTTVHILPFFPYSSDDGFSVIDYARVDDALGDWEDIARIHSRFALMFDLVINHISAQSRPFREYLAGNGEYEGYFIEVEPGTDVSGVFRPRALPLVSHFERQGRDVGIWTTFSEDQIDLNFARPEVLLYILEVLLLYLSRGASIIRLDAIAYLWKEIGTTCLHLPQTHMVVKLFRDIFDIVAPHAKILTETNVPHRENISYFGDGRDEAHMVYNFALPPLVAHSIITGDAGTLSMWARTLHLPSDATWFYNFTASHDGIGVLPAQDLLTDEQIERLVELAVRRGGRVGYKSNPDGSKKPYELNISLFDLLSDPGADEPIDIQVGRMIASQAIALTLAGVPALYYHSVIGSRNDYQGVMKTGANRAINREKVRLEKVIAEIGEEGAIRNRVYRGLRDLIRTRRTLPAFHPSAGQSILSLDDRVFAVERTPRTKSRTESQTKPRTESKTKSATPSESGARAKGTVLALINVSGETLSLKPDHPCRRDVLTGRTFDGGTIDIGPYGVLWLTE
jgi:glycosidase